MINILEDDIFSLKDDMDDHSDFCGNINRKINNTYMRKCEYKICDIFIINFPIANIIDLLS